MKLFWMILIMHQPFDLERPNSEGYHRWVKDVFLLGQTHPYPKGAGPSALNFRDPYWRPYGLA